MHRKCFSDITNWYSYKRKFLKEIMILKSFNAAFTCARIQLSFSSPSLAYQIFLQQIFTFDDNIIKGQGLFYLVDIVFSVSVYLQMLIYTKVAKWQAISVPEIVVREKSICLEHPYDNNTVTRQEITGSLVILKKTVSSKISHDTHLRLLHENFSRYYIAFRNKDMSN